MAVWAPQRTSRPMPAGSAPQVRQTAPPGSFAFSGHDRTHRPYDSGRSLRKLCAACGSRTGSNLRLEVRRAKRRVDTGSTRPPFHCRQEMAPGISIFTPMADGSTRSRKKARPSSCSTTIPQQADWPHGRRSPDCPADLPAAISARRSLFPATAGLSTPATGCTTASRFFPLGQTAS